MMMMVTAEAQPKPWNSCLCSTPAMMKAEADAEAVQHCLCSSVMVTVVVMVAA